jgi:cysteine desulfurase
MGRRAGTENLIGIAGFGAAAEAAQRDLANGVWDEVGQIRNILEQALSSQTKGTIFVGNGVDRLPNTTCLLAPGWKGETQVMAMDLAGFAISAGSACSSGKVRASRVLGAMGFDAGLAAQAVRISIGPGVSRDDVLRFADAWSAGYAKVQARAA